MGRRAATDSIASQIADWLKAGNTITPKEANDRFHTRRLSAIIYELIHKRGMNVVNLMGLGPQEAVYKLSLEPLPAESSALSAMLQGSMEGISTDALDDIAKALARAKSLMNNHPDGLWGVQQAVSEIEVQLAALDPTNFPREDFLRKCNQEDLI